MSRITIRAAALAAFTLAIGLAAPAAFAAVADYKFDLVSARSGGPGKTDVMIRLTRLPDGKPVAGAVIFQSQAIMTGMESMPGAATAEPGAQPGSYLVHASTAMAGPWTLHVSAKIQGEADTLHTTVTFDAGQ